MKTTVLILCGGKGTRLQGLFPHTPKPLICVAGRPFIEWVILLLMNQGLRSFVLSAGYLADKIKFWVRNTGLKERVFLNISVEIESLGTGGGIINALPLCDEYVLAVNGDSLLLFNLNEVLNKTEAAAADIIMVGVYQSDCSRYGKLNFDENSFLTRLEEKAPGNGYVNGGFYFFKKSVMRHFPSNTNLSMEYDVIPELLNRGVRILVHLVDAAPFLDIGLPETVNNADVFIKENLHWF